MDVNKVKKFLNGELKRGISLEFIKENCATIGDLQKSTEEVFRWLNDGIPIRRKSLDKLSSPTD